MSEDVSWPGHQMADMLAYNAASVVITGNSFRFFATRPPAEYGRWAAVVSELLDAERVGGRIAAFRCYLRHVYTNHDFALLMASLGMLSPNGSAWDLPTGHDDRAPAKRRAVREEEVYAALRQLGEATVPDLARHTGQDRSNVYRRVQKLISRGLVQRSTTAAPITYRPAGETTCLNQDASDEGMDRMVEDAPSCASSHPTHPGSDAAPDEGMDRMVEDAPSCPSSHPTHPGSDTAPQPFKLAALVKPTAAPAAPQPSRPPQTAPVPASKKKKHHNRRSRARR